MIQVLKAQPTFAGEFARNLTSGLTEGIERGYEDYKKAKSLAAADKTIKEKLGIDLSGITDPAERKAILTESMKNLGKQQQLKEKKDFLNELFGIQEEPEQEQPKGIFAPEYEKPKKSPKKKDKFDVKNIPDEKIIAASAIDPNIARALSHTKDFQSREATAKEKFEYEKEQDKAKADAKLLEEARKETLPRRQEIAQKAIAARKGIENKNKLIDYINTGKINDPTFATVMSEILPNRLGMRFLSPETVQYKSALINEYGDLRNIFQGQTRVKEIDLLEEKVADLYLTDEQKKAILKSTIDTLQADLVEEEAAAEVERDFPYLRAIEFDKKVSEIANQKKEAIFNKILDEQKAIIQQAENKKKIPLNPKNPEDLEIMKQIKVEAGGDKEKAKQLAKKKGYSW